MYNRSPDYSQYTIEELEDVLAHIDQAQFPNRYADAKTILANKRAELAKELPKHIVKEESYKSKIKWSEQHLTTRIIVVSFLFLTLSLIPSGQYEFLTAKKWTENSTGGFWLIALSLVLIWFLSIKKDQKFAKRLLRNWRGQIAIATMPFILMMMSWQFVDKTLPLSLHVLSTQQVVQIEMEYRKRSGRKQCRYRIELTESKELEEGDLCLIERRHNRLSEKGKIKVEGTRSLFGLLIEEYEIP